MIVVSSGNCEGPSASSIDPQGKAASMISALQTIATPWHNRRYVGRHRAEDLVATPRNMSARWRTALPLGLVRGAGAPTAASPTEAAPTTTGD